jgi:hypothetical protein
MAVLTHLETDTGTSVDISGATAVGAYTANGDKLIMVDVSIDAVAGNGDYVMYLTRQIGGSGSAYRILPQTTMAAASGLTAISGQSGWITVRNGDVLTVYVDGLAGDTVTPDWSTRWFESAVTLVTLADDAITASKFDESTAFPLKSADTGATQVARVGADSDTLETLSDEIAAVKAETAAILVDTGTTLDGNITAILADTNELQAELADGGRTDLLIDAIKAKTDVIPASPAPANEYDARMTAIQADLDNPTQYKADVSGLATQTSVNAIPTSPLLAANYVAPDNASVGAIKTKTDQLVFTTPNKVDASATIDPTGLATSADLAVVDENIDEIKAKTDQMAFTVPNKIDASATVDPTGIATSEELEIIGEKVDDVLDKLNVSSVEFVTAVVGSTITILRGDTLTASLLNLGSMASYVSLDFTVKASTHQSDDAALIRVRKNASGLTDGLLRLNGAAHTTGTDGSITINDAPTGDITIMLKAGVTDDLVPGTYVYDIQLIEANEVSTLTTGTLIVSADVTRLVA